MSFKPAPTPAVLFFPRRTKIPAVKSTSGFAKMWSILAVLLVLLVLAALLALQVAFPSWAHSRKKPWETAPLGKDQVEVTRLGEESNLRIERVRFFSIEMNEPRFFLVLLPKTQAPLADVFILNHGWFDRPEYLLTYLKVDKVYGELLAEGKVRPAIVVIPDVRFENFFREHSDRFPFPNYLTLVAEEVARTVSQQYHIPFGRDHWAIGGFSFGGYLSMDVARRYAGRFGSISCISGLTDEEWTFWPSTPPPAGRLDEKGRGKQTIVDPGPVPRIFLACGKNDRQFRPMQALHERLTALGVAHEWSTGPGGHTWKYWSSVLRPMFEFHLPPSNSEEKGASQ